MHATRKAGPLLGLATLAALSLAARPAAAQAITYTEQATASGSLGATTFTNAGVTLTFAGDVANVQNQGGGFFVNTVGTATISGVGTATFTQPVEIFDNQGALFVGFAQLGGGSILDTSNAAFATYDLRSAIGPISGTSFIRPDLTFSTSAGGFNLQSAGNSTFTARLNSAVPEPSQTASLGLGALGVLGLLFKARRRKPVA